jgi:transposase-like protein
VLELITAKAEGTQESPVGATLDELARAGAQRMIAAALHIEVAEYLARYRDERDAAGHALVVRNGPARPRPVLTGVGPVTITAPRVNDRRVVAGERQKFTSAILPPYVRRSPRVESVLPLLYLHGLSSGDFREALPALLGPKAAGLSPSAIVRLTKAWTAEYEAFRRRDLGDRDYIYLWADGIHFTIRLEEERLCTLVVIGVRPDGTKEVVALEDGYRESAESWRTVLRDLKRRGLRAPVLAIGDGALGFWAAVREVWPETAEQRCWVHRIANVLDKLPKGLQPRAKQALHAIMYARRGRAGDHALHPGVPGQVPQGRGLADRRPGPAARLLRLPGRAVEAPAHHEPDRVDVRDGAPARGRDARCRLADRRVGHGVQAAAGCRRALAPPRRRRADPTRASGCPLRGWSAE